MEREEERRSRLIKSQINIQYQFRSVLIEGLTIAIRQITYTHFACQLAERNENVLDSGVIKVIDTRFGMQILD